MDITCQGENSFYIRGSKTVALNPPTGQRADIILRSRRTSGKSLVNGPGEYEIGEAVIDCLPAGGKDRQGLAFAIELDGVTVLFLDGPAGSLAEHDRRSIGRVDILLIDSADLAAVQVLARDLAPRVVIPFGANAAAMCSALGSGDIQPAPRFVWNAGTVPKAALLKTPRPRKRAA